jgi:hypothetical protein
MLSITGYGAPADAVYGAGAANYTWVPWLSDKGLDGDSAEDSRRGHGSPRFSWRSNKERNAPRKGGMEGRKRRGATAERAAFA